jgi:hypothetical protein
VKKHIKDNYKDMTKNDIKFELEEYNFVEVLIE